LRKAGKSGLFAHFFFAFSISFGGVSGVSIQGSGRGAYDFGHGT